ncbi:dopamine receptor 1-like isoform X1 [Limulus polyphemus]|uniref:Dopamine receptor 1-like isoform X1 n=1 Tax=Limulus polyphemus TaxID=6850 RepID=A0ABM1TDF8_LIMPO|nr:dopamine receptor 1-like isoform X2 [Limulus polyphemus]XP_022253901.1 dopamine receptor 1-like isoform X1 [Limulus polyphemus]XP_022253905.1 dopamine receptor 1-like isoform X1 [Limulus polyphemus]XP_022253914.1 dopamine receptor 1-like isoform X1 [Limulus polyphemus]
MSPGFVMEDKVLILNSSDDLNYTLHPDNSSDGSNIITKCLVGVLLGLIIFFSITGNLLVCLAIYKDRGLRKLGNLFLVSLALADLFVASLVMTFAVANDLMNYWIFGSGFCDIWIAFDVMCCTASILNLCAVSLERFIHIKDPLRYSRWMTKRVVFGSICLIWLLSALLSFFPISLGWHKPRRLKLVSKERPMCTLELTPVYAVVSSSISFFVPCVVMIALYGRLYFYAKKHVKSILAVTKPSENKASHSSQHKSSHLIEHKASITVGIIVGVFLVCWVPFFSVNIIAAFCKSCISDLVWKSLTWLGYFNSALNPVIYSIFNAEFRNAFRKVLFYCSFNTPGSSCASCQLCCASLRQGKNSKEKTVVALQVNQLCNDIYRNEHGKVSEV